VGESADSAEASATPAADAVPPAPTGLAAAGGDTQVALQWSAAAGAGSYRVKRATVAGGPYATVATVTDTSFVDASVVNETGYTYVVSAVSLIGESADSAEVAVTPHQGTVIVDDAQPDCVFTGVWTVSQGSPGYYGTGYHHDGNTGAAGGKRAAFTPQLFTAGNYEVLVRAPSDANRAANIPVDIVHAGGTTTRTLNEQYNNNTWVSLGRYVCGAGSTASVTLRNDGTNGYVVADAVKWTLVAPAAPAGVAAVPGNAEVALAWSPSVGANVYTVKRATVSGGPYTALGTITGSTFTDDTAANGTTYFYIVTASDLLRGEGAASAEVAATPPYGSAIIDDADGAPACTFTGAWPVSQGSPGYYGTGYHHDGNTGATGGLRATYTPDLVADATYEVFLRAPSDPNRASNIPVDIVHADGTTTVTVNEQLHNNTWVSLGSYVFHAGSGGSVTLRNDGANGYVVADAVRWIPTTPLAPAALAASADTNRVALTWSASRFATGYVVRRGTAAGGPFATIATTVDGTSFDDAAVAAGVTYYYVVAAANDLGIGAASPPAAATLLVPPSVAITPAVADATAGGSVTFSAAAAGTAPLTYQWRKAGVALAEATAPTLTLDPLSTADAGSYDVVVTNPVGTAVSGPATLDVSKAEAAITLDGLFQTYDGGTHPVTADTTPAGLTVSLTYDGSAEPPVTAGLYPVVATVADPDFTGTGAGTLIIAKATAAVALAPLTQAYDGTPRSVTATTSPAGLPVDLLYDGGVAAPVYPGAHTVTATVADPNYAGTATATLTLTTTALVRHAPTLDGTVHGSVQVAEPESVSLNGSTTVSGDLLLSGLPTIRLNGQPLLAGVRDAAGAPSPGTHVVTLNGGAVLRYVVRRVDAPSWPVVGAPPAPTGIRDVTLGRPGDPTGDFATIRSLTLDGQAGRVAVPSGTYGTLTANGGSTLALGTAGASTPDVYWLQGLVLNGGARLEIDGPVLLVLAQSVVLNGLAGDAAHPDWLRLEIAAGGLTLDGGATLHGEVVAPAGQVVLNGGSAIHGRIVADRFLLNGGGLLEEP
jgi:fibronectin type 3 domain-containing protein